EDERGAPVAGAEVNALTPRAPGAKFDLLGTVLALPQPPAVTQTTTSGPDGRFRLSQLPPGSYTIVARKAPMAACVRRNVVVTPASESVPLRLVLPEGFKIEGRVKRKNEGPVAGLPVVAFRVDFSNGLDLSAPDKVMSRTREKGEFAL